jgi:transcriptional regulator with XRE-family HTH domain
MKFKDKYNIEPGYEHLFKFDNIKSEIDHESKMIMFRFFSELEKFNGKPIIKKDLAKSINTTASYITQLFNGDKLVNLTTLAKIQEAYNITFEIKANATIANYNDEVLLLNSNIPDFNESNTKSKSNLYIVTDADYDSYSGMDLNADPIMKAAI